VITKYALICSECKKFVIVCFVRFPINRQVPCHVARDSSPRLDMKSVHSSFNVGCSSCSSRGDGDSSGSLGSDNGSSASGSSFCNSTCVVPQWSVVCPAHRSISNSTCVIRQWSVVCPAHRRISNSTCVVPQWSVVCPAHSSISNSTCVVHQCG